MSKLAKSLAICVVVGLVVNGTLRANWAESFDGDELDLATWVFTCIPDVTKTFTHPIKTDPNGNKYLSFDETSSVGVGAQRLAPDLAQTKSLRMYVLGLS